MYEKTIHIVFGLCVVALSRNLKLTTTLDGAITQSPCYVPLNFKGNETYRFVEREKSELYD